MESQEDTNPVYMNGTGDQPSGQIQRHYPMAAPDFIVASHQHKKVTVILGSTCVVSWPFVASWASDFAVTTLTCSCMDWIWDCAASRSLSFCSSSSMIALVLSLQPKPFPSSAGAAVSAAGEACMTSVWHAAAGSCSGSAAWGLPALSGPAGALWRLTLHIARDAASAVKHLCFERPNRGIVSP